KTDEAREKLFKERYPNADFYAEDLLALARKYPRDPAAVDALVWVARHARGQPLLDAVAILGKDHVPSDKIGPVCRMVIHRLPPDTADPFLRAVLEKNPDRATRAAALFALAESDRNEKGAEVLFEHLRKEYGDIKTGSGDRTYGRLAE